MDVTRRTILGTLVVSAASFALADPAVAAVPAAGGPTGQELADELPQLASAFAQIFQP